MSNKLDIDKSNQSLSQEDQIETQTGTQLPELVEKTPENVKEAKIKKKADKEKFLSPTPSTQDNKSVFSTPRSKYVPKSITFSPPPSFQTITPSKSDSIDRNRINLVNPAPKNTKPLSAATLRRIERRQHAQRQKRLSGGKRRTIDTYFITSQSQAFDELSRGSRGSNASSPELYKKSVSTRVSVFERLYNLSKIKKAEEYTKKDDDGARTQRTYKTTRKAVTKKTSGPSPQKSKLNSPSPKKQTFHSTIKSPQRKHSKMRDSPRIQKLASSSDKRLHNIKEEKESTLLSDKASKERHTSTDSETNTPKSTMTVFDRLYKNPKQPPVAKIDNNDITPTSKASSLKSRSRAQIEKKGNHLKKTHRRVDSQSDVKSPESVFERLYRKAPRYSKSAEKSTVNHSDQSSTGNKKRKKSRDDDSGSNSTIQSPSESVFDRLYRNEPRRKHSHDGLQESPVKLKTARSRIKNPENEDGHSFCDSTLVSATESVWERLYKNDYPHKSSKNQPGKPPITPKSPFEKGNSKVDKRSKKRADNFSFASENNSTITSPVSKGTKPNQSAYNKISNHAQNNIHKTVKEDKTKQKKKLDVSRRQSSENKTSPAIPKYIYHVNDTQTLVSPTKNVGADIANAKTPNISGGRKSISLAIDTARSPIIQHHKPNNSSTTTSNEHNIMTTTDPSPLSMVTFFDNLTPKESAPATTTAASLDLSSSPISSKKMTTNKKDGEELTIGCSYSKSTATGTMNTSSPHHELLHENTLVSDKCSSKDTTNSDNKIVDHETDVKNNDTLPIDDSGAKSLIHHADDDSSPLVAEAEMNDGHNDDVLLALLHNEVHGDRISAFVNKGVNQDAFSDTDSDSEIISNEDAFQQSADIIGHENFENNIVFSVGSKMLLNTTDDLSNTFDHSLGSGLISNLPPRENALLSEFEVTMEEELISLYAALNKSQDLISNESYDHSLKRENARYLTSATLVKMQSLIRKRIAMTRFQKAIGSIITIQRFWRLHSTLDYSNTFQSKDSSGISNQFDDLFYEFETTINSELVDIYSTTDFNGVTPSQSPIKLVYHDDMMDEHEDQAAITIQSAWRRYNEWVTYQFLRTYTIKMQRIYRRNLLENKKLFNQYSSLKASRVQEESIMEISVVSIQKWFRSVKYSREYNQKRLSSITIQSGIRRYIVLNHIEQKRISAAKITKFWKSHKSKFVLSQNRMDKSATMIQSKWRSFSECVKYQLIRVSITKIQRIYKRNRIENLKKVENMTRHHAAKKIQNVWRNYYLNLLEKYILNNTHKSNNAAATIIQKTWRRYAMQVDYEILLLSAYVNNEAAICLQRCWRGYTVRVNYELFINGTILIQRSWRGYSMRTSYKQLQTSSLNMQRTYRYYRLRNHIFNEQRAAKQRFRAAVVIQCLWRGCAAQRQRENTTLMGKSAIRLQTWTRSLKCRRTYGEKVRSIILLQSIVRRHIVQYDVERKRCSVNKIISMWRRYSSDRKNAQKNMEQASTVIQSVWRGYSRWIYYKFLQKSTIRIQRTYRRSKIRKEVVSRQIQARAAMVVQRAWRSYSCQLFLQKSLRKKSVLCVQTWIRSRKCRRAYTQQQISIIIIQSHTRRYIVQNNLEQKHQSAIKIASMWKHHMLKRKAAICIQSHFRGYFEWLNFQLLQISVIRVQRVYRYNKSRQLMLREKEAAAKIIQHKWRNYSLHLLEDQRAIMDQSATCIQNSVRSSLCRKVYMKKRVCVILIQSVVRQYIVQHDLEQKHQSAMKIASMWKHHMLKRKAATIIQSTWRCYTVFVNYQILKLSTIKMQRTYRHYTAQAQELDARKASREAAAKIIQHKWRNYSLHLLQDQRALMDQSATCIQKSVRSSLCRRVYMDKRACVILIQSVVRQYIVQHDLEQKHQSAMKIASMWRTYVSVQTQKNKRLAAVCIQKTWRRYAMQVDYEILLLSAYVNNEAAICLQRCWRGYTVRVNYELFIIGASIIQSAWRGYFMRTNYKQLQTSSLNMQRIYRYYRLRNHILNEQRAAKQRFRAAVVIQCLWRGCAAQRQRENITFIKNNETRINSITLIQSIVRRHIAQCDVERKRCSANQIISIWRRYSSDRKNAQKNMDQASTVIQSVWRGYSGWINYQLLRILTVRMQRTYRRSKIRKEVVSKKIKARAAMVVQRAWRSYSCQLLLLDQKFLIDQSAIRLQTLLRSIRCKRTYEVKRSYAILIQSVTRRYIVQRDFEQKRYNATRISSMWRKYLARQKHVVNISPAIELKESFDNTHSCSVCELSSLIILQSFVRKLLIRRSFLSKIESALLIQSFWRAVRHQRLNSSATLLQCVVRRYLAKRRCLQLRQSQESVSTFSYVKSYLTVFSSVLVPDLWTGSSSTKNKDVEMNESAVVIQAMVRKLLVRQSLLRYHQCARIIQLVWREYNTRRFAATMIQKHVRRMILWSMYYNNFSSFNHSGRHPPSRNVHKAPPQSRCAAQFSDLRGSRYSRCDNGKWKLRSLIQFIRGSNKIIAFIKEIELLHVMGVEAKKRRSRQNFTVRQLSNNFHVTWKKSSRVNLTNEKSGENIIFDLTIILQVDSGERCISSGYSSKRFAQKLLDSKLKEIIPNRINAMRLFSAKVIIRAWKSFKQRKFASINHAHHNSIIMIQKSFRKYYESQRYSRAIKNIIILQSWARMQLCLSALPISHYRCSTIHIQKWWRGCSIRLKKRMICAAVLTIQNAYRRKKHHRETIVAAAKIQEKWRKYFMRKSEDHAKRGIILLQSIARSRKIRRMLKKYSESARDIQRIWRGILQRNQTLIDFKMILKIQSWFRMKACRSIFNKKLSSVQKIQVLWKGYTERKNFVLNRKKIIIIQKCVRRILARKQVVSSINAAILIQRYYQNSLSRKLNRDIRKAILQIKEDDENKKSDSAKIVQSTWRGYTVYVNYQILKLSTIKMQRTYRHYTAQAQELDARKASREAAAKIIQHKWRNYSLHLLQDQRALMDQSATCIQKSVRSSLCRKAYMDKRACVILIQSVVRQYIVQHDLEQKHKSAMKIASMWKKKMLKRKAAICIQSTWRCYTVFVNYQILKLSTIKMQRTYRHYTAQAQELDARKASREAAAKIIQHKWRNYSLHLLQDQRALMDQSATCIQRSVRSSLCRKVYMDKRACVILIQSVVRQYIVKHDLEQKHQSAIMIASIWKKKMLRRKAAICIQSTWRCYTVFVNYQILKVLTIKMQRTYRHYTAQAQELDARKASREAAAKIIQHKWRNYSLHLLQDQRALMDQSATCIQRSVRSSLCRKAYMDKRVCLVLIQSVVRQYIVQHDLEQKHQSAMKIASMWKHHMLKRKAAICIQSTWRGYTVYVNYQILKLSTIKMQRTYRHYTAQAQELDARKASREAAAKIIQHKWRNYSLHLLQDQRALMDQSATCIQKSVRSSLCRRVYMDKRACLVLIQSVVRQYNVQHDLEQKHKSAIKIASMWKNHMLKRKAATCIQSTWRGYTVYVNYQILKLSTIKMQRTYRRNLARLKATMLLQRVLRGYFARNLFQVLLNENAAIYIQKSVRSSLRRKAYMKKRVCVVLIQSVVRQYIVQHDLEQKHQSAIMIASMWKHHMLKRKAAICIQSTWRGYTVYVNYQILKLTTIKMQRTYRRNLARLKASLLLQSVLRCFFFFWKKYHYLA